MSGTSYWFAARDEAAAESLADALAAFGFGEVAAYPTCRKYLVERGMGWELAAFDGNRYPAGNIGLQQELAVIRRARAIARAHGGFATGGSATRPSGLEAPGPRAARRCSGRTRGHGLAHPAGSRRSRRRRRVTSR